MAIEFSRNITFGQYLDLGSAVHRLDPRVKIIAVAAFMLAILSARNFTAMSVGILGALIIHAFSKIPASYVWRGMRLLFGTMLFFASFQVIFFPNPVNPWWQWGIASLSLQGLAQGLLLILRVLMLYYMSSTLMFTTALMDLADGVETLFAPLKRLRVPVNELVMTFIISLKFTPLLVTEIERTIKARAARGDRFDQGNLIERGQRIGKILIPLFVNALNRAEVLTVAMNARCYRGGQGRTRRRVLHFERSDYLALAGIALVTATMLVLGRAPLP